LKKLFQGGAGGFSAPLSILRFCLLSQDFSYFSIGVAIIAAYMKDIFYILGFLERMCIANKNYIREIRIQ